MGWADCGKDSNGRPIGYAFPATCDHPGCKAKIDRGLAYACGGMHGEQSTDDIWCCEGYFCEKHLTDSDKTRYFVCEACAKTLEKEDVLGV